MGSWKSGLGSCLRRTLKQRIAMGFSVRLGLVGTLVRIKPSPSYCIHFHGMSIVSIDKAQNVEFIVRLWCIANTDMGGKRARKFWVKHTLCYDLYL